jgi:hypothetical protein
MNYDDDDDIARGLYSFKQYHSDSLSAQRTAILKLNGLDFV